MGISLIHQLSKNFLDLSIWLLDLFWGMHYHKYPITLSPPILIGVSREWDIFPFLFFNKNLKISRFFLLQENFVLFTCLFMFICLMRMLSPEHLDGHCEANSIIFLLCFSFNKVNIGKMIPYIDFKQSRLNWMLIDWSYQKYDLWWPGLLCL